MKTLIALFLMISPALAETKVMLLTDADQQRIIRLVDMAVKGNGVNAVMDAAEVLKALMAAGTLQDQKPVTEPPKEPK